jgi:uncharacterized protein YxeA
MEQYNQYVKQHQPALIGILLLLCLVIAGGVTYNAVMLNRLEKSIATTNSYVTQNMEAIQNNSQSLDNIGQNVQGNGQLLQQTWQEVNQLQAQE